MQTTLSILFGVSTLINALAMAISITLSEKPRSFEDHILGVAKLLILTGALSNWAALMSSGYNPPWHITVHIMGMAVFACVYAKNNWFAAKAREKARLHAWYK